MLDVTDQGKPDEQDEAQQRIARYPVRRTPNFLRFVITGAVIGFVVGAIIATSGADAEGYSARTGIALIGAIVAAFGALLAAVVALVLERVLNRQ